MKNTTKLLVSAVTHIGAACSINDDRIFANGRFVHPSLADYAQISLETDCEKCFFAVSDGMEDDSSGISLTNDLKKFYRKAQSSSKDIQVKLDELIQYIEQSSNLIHSVSLGDNGSRGKKTAFAGVLIDDDSVAAVNMGSCRIYKLVGDTFKLLVNDYKRAERLLKMGIISSEQAELLASQQKAAAEDGGSAVKKSDIGTLQEGTVYMICSSGLTDAVSEDTIYDILASNPDPDEAASVMVAEAVKNKGEDNMTVMIIKVEESEAEDIQAALPIGSKSVQARAPRPAGVPVRIGRTGSTARKKSIDYASLVSFAILVVLAVAVFFGIFKLWSKIQYPEGKGVSGQKDPVESTAAKSGGTTEDKNGTDASDSGSESDASDEPTVDSSSETSGTEKDTTEYVGPEGTTYVVKSGDMLMKISKKFYGDESKYKLIMDANGIKDPDKISIGQVLIIPPLK